MPTRLDAREVARLFKAHGPMVYRRAYRLMGNAADAEEMTQEVFIRVLRGTGGYEGRGELVGWLYRICTNLCLNQIRNRKRRRALFEQHVSTPRAAPETGDRPVDLVMLRWLLANAESRQAQAAVYVYLDGLTYAEAGELIGCAKRTVGNLLDRFRAWAEQQAAAYAEAGRSE